MVTTRAVEQEVLNEQGVALLTVMLLMLMMIVLGITAFTVTGLDNRMAGLLRTKEVAATAAESCEGTAVNIIQQALFLGQIPAEFLDNATPAGPIPASNSTTLFSEISGQPLPSPPFTSNTIAENHTDSASASPNLQLLSIPGYSVKGDVDRLFKRYKEGSGTLKEIVYRITCVSSNVATGIGGTVTSVYSCTVGETCMKQIGNT